MVSAIEPAERHSFPGNLRKICADTRAWFQDPKWNPLDRFKPTVTAALWASLTISLGSLAFNAMITDLINLAVWILENIIDASKFHHYQAQTSNAGAETPLVPGLNSCLACCVGTQRLQERSGELTRFLQLGFVVDMIATLAEKFNRCG